MRKTLYTIAAAALFAASASSLAFAQSQNGYQPGNGVTTPPSYGSTYPQPAGSRTDLQSHYSTGARSLGQPSPTMGMPGGNQPSASAHTTPG
jgi:hypothetical protein